MTTSTLIQPEVIRANRKAWLEALRSGDFSQAREVLHNGTGYCCLGVACHIAGVPMIQVLDEDYRSPRYAFGEEGDALVLPLEGQEWLGLTDGNPNLDMPHLRQQGTEESQAQWGDDQSLVPTNVAELNDKGFTFAQIADLIEYFGFVPQVDVLQGAKRWGEEDW